ncbi:sugar transferase [Deinococcus aquatilis]|uniref:sugar transferase n=1 Tax=Deinococcus aquatilis TaxID=519440 RepID=UPI0003695579|nr:sugar transferase [Deinococcus aquatilis]
MGMQTNEVGSALGLSAVHSLIRPLALTSKRGLDMACVLVSAPLWVPLCGLIAVLIWLEDRANPLFLQDRVGLGGALFPTWKFRTMRPNAEQLLQDTLLQNAELRAEWEANHKLRRDPRITRIGRLLRKTSLDELPQLVNVLQGQMSLVGPRPLPPYHAQQLALSVQLTRQRVRPGMTGLWQVSGRSAAGNLGMEQWDPYYVRHWSLRLDFLILVRTLKVVLGGTGAY